MRQDLNGKGDTFLEISKLNEPGIIVVFSRHFFRAFLSNEN